MSQVTRFNGDYQITGVDAAGNLIVTASTLLVNGNLIVTGSSSSITSTDTRITDNVITLNHGEIGPGVTLKTAGIDVDRGSLVAASIYWNETPMLTEQGFLTSDTIPPRWEITDANGVFHPIATSATFSVVNDIAPQLGGDLDTHGMVIYDSTGDSVAIAFGISMYNVDITPTVIPGCTAIYTNTPSSGGSGMFVANEVTPRGEELITKSRAVLFALIL